MITPVDQFTREELQALITKAISHHDAVANKEWKLAFSNLILSLSTLDAFIARSTVQVNQSPPDDIGWGPVAEEGCGSDDCGCHHG